MRKTVFAGGKHDGVPLDRVPRLQRVGADFKQFIRNNRGNTRTKNYICKHGDDLPEIRDWKWPY